MDQDLLGRIPLFAKLNAEPLAALTRLLKQQRVAAQQPIFWIGEQGTDFYLLQEGRASVSYPDDTGHEVTIAVLNPGDFFGEISLLDGGAHGDGSVQGDVELLTLAREDFLKFLEAHPSAAIHILTVLGQRHRDMLEKLRGVKNVNEVAEESMNLWYRIADKIAAIAASGTFLGLHVVWFVVWIVPNVLQGEKGFDPFPFGLLTMIVSLEAIILSIIIMVSQNRAGEKDRIRADLDYQVNLRAHLAVMQLHQKMDRIENALIAGGAGNLVGGGTPTSAAERMLGISPDGEKRKE